MPPTEDLAHRAEVHDLMARYAHAIDRGELDQLDSVFTSDAHLDYTATGGAAGGYPEVKAWLADVLPRFAVRQHFVTNVVVRFAADRGRAASTAYFLNPMGYRDADGRLHLFQVAGYYHDELVRTPAGWRITRRRQERTWQTAPQPAGQV